MHTDISSERGNVIFMVLIAVLLIGYLSVAVMNGGNNEAEIDQESLSIKVSQVRSQVSEFERGVHYILQNGIAEDEIRFAHNDAAADYGDLSTAPAPSPANQLFHPDGGGASYRLPPSGISDGSAWEFYGHTALPAVGSDRADLVAVLPNVTEAFCAYINVNNNQPEALDDTGTCIYSIATQRFSAGDQYDDSPNTLDEASFAQDTTISAVKPAPQGCVTCGDGKHHFYHVLLAR
jgi:hypothetical protein